MEKLPVGYYKRNNGSEALLQVVGYNEIGDYLCHWLFGTGKPFTYPKNGFEHEFVPVEESIITALERQRCGRRGEGVAMLEAEPLPDYWRVLPNGDKTCSFCGSLHPETLVELIKQHGFGIIERSTKNYKWYVNRPGVSNAMLGGIKYYRQHDTQEFIDQYNALLGGVK